MLHSLFTHGNCEELRKPLINGDNHWKPIRPLRPLPENHLEPVRTIITGNRKGGIEIMLLSESLCIQTCALLFAY